jgi:hypothetical protein
VATVTLGELRAHLEGMAQGALRDLITAASYEAAIEGEDLVRRNIEARLDRHSGKLITSVRSTVDEAPDAVTMRLLAGGEHAGLVVPYALVQEEGGTVRSTRPNGMLAIPVGPALTGDEQPRYPTARLTPHMVLIVPGDELVDGPAERALLINKHTGEVWYVLQEEIEIEGRHYMRDAIRDLEAAIPATLAHIWKPALTPAPGAA